ncbi:coiled-coil domain-containing protein 172 isoform X2 [Fundulus heteroclitus]|uniref:coiled-coil domain-containing protein 172 isoform X2 n=1 Tax=Fundulus heteroclitus TaxID=8078 RepID=UPI000644AFEE|nr:coiled-coil domain-containing protein 172 isoform X2 [Fundulus heteroclitus]
MSLDSLFQQILLTEHQLTEQTQKLKDVKVEIIRQQERIKSETEKYKQTTEELDKKGQQLSAMTLQCDLMRKCEDQMLKQIEERLRQQNHLRDHLAKIKQQSKEEEQQFLEEMMRFNSDFSLPDNRAAVFESQTHAEILALQRDVEALHKEMDEMKRSNIHMSSTLEEKRQLLLDLQDLENIQKDLDQQMQEAQATTASLRAESQDVSQKHLTDSTCLSLRKELETLKDGDLEEQRQALRSEVHFLQSKLKSSQDSDQR